MQSDMPLHTEAEADGLLVVDHGSYLGAHSLNYPLRPLAKMEFGHQEDYQEQLISSSKSYSQPLPSLSHQELWLDGRNSPPI